MITSRCSVSVVLALVSLLMIPIVSIRGQDAEVEDVNAPDVNAPGVKLKVDGDRIKSYIEWMSRDKLEGRRTLTQGYRQAADWAADKFEKWGLKPAGEDGTYFQNVVIKRKFTFRAGRPDLKVGKHLFLMDEEDFSVHDASTAATSVKAEVVFVGYGISAPDLGLDEYADVNVADSIALVLKGSPNDVSPARRDDADQEKPPDPWKDYVSDQTKIQTAYDKGAAAILLYDINPPDPDSSRRRRRDPDEKEDLKFERDFLVFTISGRVCRAIMKTDSQESVQGFLRRLRQMKKDIGHKKAQSKLVGTKVQLKGYDRVEEYSEEKGNNKGRNVLAKIEGTDPKLKDQYIVMGGHMDHLGMYGGYVYSGADDNASGTAAVMEVARVLSEADFKPKRTIIFACWTGEELGLLGSKHYVSEPCDGVSIDRVVTYFNMDMVGLGEKIGAPGALNFPSIWEVIKRDQDEDVMAAIEPRVGGPGGSDHSAFITKGIESLALMTCARPASLSCKGQLTWLMRPR
ncbi:MAG: M20/M25/M40 family metallo-hydrolase [Planctomycetota bacterium]